MREEKGDGGSIAFFFGGCFQQEDAELLDKGNEQERMRVLVRAC